MQIRCIPTYLLFNNSTKVLNRRSSNAFFWLALLRNEPIGVAPTRVCTTRTTVSFCSLLRLLNASIMGVFACDHRCVIVSPAAPPTIAPSGPPIMPPTTVAAAAVNSCLGIPKALDVNSTCSSRTVRSWSK